MRVGWLALVLSAFAMGCGDDDSAALRDGGFAARDATVDNCVPYYLATGLCEPGSDAGMGAAVNLSGLSCEPTEGRADTECADIAWDFACGEHLDLIGCCTLQGACGVIDPTGVLGCIDRQVFGELPLSCTADPGMDAGAELDAGDDDASAAAI
jgi:hypothetical protein